MLAFLLWLAAGFRNFDAEARFGVLDGSLLGARQVRIEGGWALAPPALLRLTTYPRSAVELPLPGPEDAGLRSSEGSRFGVSGVVTLRVISDRCA